VLFRTLLWLLAPVPGVLRMTDWSSVGRRSRRKGKAFEQLVARYLSEVSGHQFTSTRNSGRTDIKGDVYSSSSIDTMVIECKDRALSIKSMMTGCSWLKEAIAKAEKEAGVGNAAIMFVKADGVVFVSGPEWAVCRLHKKTPFTSIGDCEVKDVHGRHWRRVVLSRSRSAGR